MPIKICNKKKERKLSLEIMISQSAAELKWPSDDPTIS